MGCRQDLFRPPVSPSGDVDVSWRMGRSTSCKPLCVQLIPRTVRPIADQLRADSRPAAIEVGTRLALALVNGVRLGIQEAPFMVASRRLPDPHPASAGKRLPFLRQPNWGRGSRCSEARQYRIPEMIRGTSGPCERQICSSTPGVEPPHGVGRHPPDHSIAVTATSVQWWRQCCTFLPSSRGEGTGSA